MDKPKILVILGSIREGRAGEKVARWFMEAMKGNTDAELELADLKDYPLPMFADKVSPFERGANPHPNPQVQKWLDKVKEADGYVIISAEYNHGIPSALKNALDYPFVEWHGKPIGFVAYGGVAGGARVVEALRLVSAELSMYSVREAVYIPFIWAAFDEQGNLANAEMHAKTATVIVDKVGKLAVKLKS